MSEKMFKVPWGSESVCYWCKKNGECRLYVEDPELSVGGFSIRFTQLLRISSLQGCPINEFDPETHKLPENFKDCKIVLR
jgi:hypothetical protein